MATHGSQSSRNRPALYKPTDFGSQQKRLISTSASNCEAKKEEEKVTFKIQQRPTSEEKSPIMENKKSLKILKESPPTSEKKGSNVKNSDENPGGIAQKDIDKITKLKEFMAKQQVGDKEHSKEAATAAGRHSGPGMGKFNMSNTKSQPPVTTRIATAIFDKTSVSQGKIGSGDVNPPGIISGKSGMSKPFKENKDPEITREEKPSKGKGQRDVKDGKNRSGGRGGNTNRNQKNANKSPATGRNKSNQNEKTGGKINNPIELTQQGKQTSKSPGANNGGARPKIISKDAIINANPRLPNESHKNHNRHDRSQKQVSANSYYSQANKIPGFNNEPPPWLTHSMNGLNLNNKSILGQPQGPHVPGSKDSDQTKMAAVNGPSSNQKKVVTVAASKDKSEQKKSLDFVKSFFDNDPEVQYHRKLNADTKGTSAVSVPVASGSKEERSVKKLHAPKSHLSSHGDAHVNSHANNHANSHNNHVNTQSFHSSLHIPGSQNPGAHITDSLASTYSSVYHHSNMTHNNLHPNPQSEHFQGTSTASAAHMGATPTQLHAAISSHPSSLHHNQTYDLYSQVNQINPLLTASNYHGAMSNYPPAMSHNISNVNHGFPSYSGYFPDGSHLSHGHHIQQQLDPNVVTEILQKSGSKNWQEKALTKCGPIDSSQARSLIEQLIDDTYECMVCCETIKWINQVWSCSNCYHVFHLSCIRKWARSETAAVKDESGWRCPGCQNVSTRPPNKYYCFCGKVRDPDWNPRDGITPHSCGEVCCKKRTNPPCEHNCNELCHPGPCPTCPVMVAKHCPCGKTITKARCGQINSFKCESTCSKYLSCGVHRCQMQCHQGECGYCEIKHSEECFCGRERHYVVCGTNEVIPDEIPGPEEKCPKKYTCHKPCNKKLACKNHDCEELCHSGECKSCVLLPNNVVFCPCGKHRVSTLLADGEARTSCLDPIPTCESFCGKKLLCGPKGLSHLCMMKCHTGKCQPCQKVTTVQCRCGATKKEISCKELNPGEDILCERKCNKKRKCGRHKCNQKCCTDRDHACNIICGKKLSCGMHKCEEVCHTGFCPPCWRAGFDELACNCGTTVLYPPIACGLKPPECDQPCARKHPCGHPPTHTCHSDEACPPCTLLINKQCMGGHEIWKNVPCHLSDVSCGRNCGKILPCGFHKCIKTCHKGNCLEEGEVCVQPCPVKRKDCSHPCGARCHAGLMECLATPCKAQITIRCRCGRKSANAFCLAGSVTSAYESFNSEILTNQLRNLQSGQSIDLASLTSAEKKPKFLDCDEECSRLERNRKLAEALGIENPEGGHFQATNYSSFLKQEAKSQFAFVQKLEEILENLVANVKKSSQSQIQHSLPPMNATQRKIVHELADVYGCKTYSLDPEPKRNTVVVATKESYIPSIKLSTLAEREIMSPVPPQPVMLCKDGQTYMVLGPQVKPILKKTQSAVTQPKVDYFDDNYK